MSQKNSNVAIIIPVYNESPVIGGVLKDVLKKFPVVVCVDDGSTDDSIQEINKTEAILVKHPINMGQGAALQTGVEMAVGINKIDYFVTFDADGQHRISDVEKMLKVMKKDPNLDIILGSRFLGDAQGITKVKKALLKVAVAFSNWTSGTDLTDTHNGLRVFSRKFAEALDLTSSDMSHASEIVEFVSQGKFNYTEVPVSIRYTDYSKSKGQSMINAVNIGFDTLIKKVLK